MRRLTTLTTLAAIILTAAGTAAARGNSGPHSAASTMEAEVFFKCPSGYAFEVSGSAAHCKKPAYTDRRELGGCLVAFPTFRQDRVGSKDMCSGTNPLTGEVLMEAGCKVEDTSAGYTKRIVAGRDFCGKLMPQQIQAPNVAVSLTV
jgi:hypothetical protein